jgi:hypothetical protein
MEEERNVIFTIARMNPPTQGHKMLIETMLNKAMEVRSSRVYIILSSSVDNIKNPLECDEKRTIINTGVVNKIKEEWVEKNGIPELEVICMNENIDRS